jgi:hypothetical protein
MGTREFVNSFCSSRALDYTDEDRLMVAMTGPRGGSSYYMMTPIQARTLRDSLDLALLKINGARIRAEEGR